MSKGLDFDRLRTGKLFAQRYRTSGYTAAYLCGAAVGTSPATPAQIAPGVPAAIPAVEK